MFNNVQYCDQTRQDCLLRLDQPGHWFWRIKRIIKKINAEFAPVVSTLSCWSNTTVCISVCILGQRIAALTQKGKSMLLKKWIYESKFIECHNSHTGEKHLVVIYATFPAKVFIILKCYILFTFTINEQSERLRKRWIDKNLN